MGGPSAAAAANEQAQTAFYNQMTAEQSQQFSNQSEILSQLQGMWGPVLKAGIGQQGFTPEENAALRTEITDTGATSAANAKDAALLRMKQESGGADVLPSGAKEGILTNADVLSQQKTAGHLTAETAANYAQGRQNFENATTAFSGVAGLQNPIGYAGASTSAGGQATNAINLADTESSSLLDTVLGGLASGAGQAAGMAAMA